MIDNEVNYLTVMYGSEASVLTHYYTCHNETILKIYNKKKPAPVDNSYCCQLHDLEETLAQIVQQHDFDGIRFIGAGFLEQSTLFIAEEKENINLQLSTNIHNYLTITQILLPYMIQKRHGRFVYLSSIRAVIGGTGTSIYSASKAFGERYFSTIGQEYGKLGVTAVSIRMGFFQGRMIEEYSEERQRAVLSSISNKRLGNPDDLQKTIEHCFSNQYLNGGIIDLNGGLSYG